MKKKHSEKRRNKLNLAQTKKVVGEDKINQRPRYNGIAVRLILSFMLPVIFVIIIGAVSYQKAAGSIMNSYKKESKQALEMTGEYLRFGFDSIEADAIQFAMEGNVQKYFNGSFSYSVIEGNRVLEDISNALLAKQVSDDFVENIHILSKNSEMKTTAGKTSTGLYQKFTETQEGSRLLDNSSDSYWIGFSELLDQEVAVPPDSYAIRFVQGFPDSKSCIIYDVSAATMNDILNRLDFGKGSKIAFITGDGKEMTRGVQ